MLLDRFYAPVERDPAHHLRVREVAPRPAHFPQSLIGVLPAGLEVLQEGALQVPRGILARDSLPARLVQRIQDLAVHVELQLARSGIAYAHRRGAFIAREPRNGPFG